MPFYQIAVKKTAIPAQGGLFGILPAPYPNFLRIFAAFISGRGRCNAAPLRIHL
jgi:hypothetical protein